MVRIIKTAIFICLALSLLGLKYDGLSRDRITVAMSVRLPENYFQGQGFGLEMLEGKVILPRVNPENIVLGREAAGVVVLVLKSGILDPGAKGYWFTFSANGGLKWTPPLYSGITAEDDFTILPYTHFPIIRVGNIRLEAHAKDFTAGDQQEPVYLLNVPLEILKRDTDSDGLTDLMEERLLTDPSNKDTDADGKPDFFDNAPLVSNKPDSEADLVRVAAMGEVIGNSEKSWAEEALEGGLNIIEVDSYEQSHEFPGLEAKFIHLTGDDVARYERKFGPRAIFRFEETGISGNRATVKWSRGESEGEVLLKKRKGQWSASN